MSLKILFADDSMTAQNMGKKILTEAGYDVVAVSNGAAAVKKIAEQKPDIIILDVYMPGYSGLEVCEKVRASMDTLKTPVLLTVGKMEPYKPEDANRVRADGVIIKPFEASDLLAIVKRFEERIGQTYAAEQTVLLRRSGEDGNAPAELPVEHPEPRPAAQPTLEVPDHMATSAAFSDLLGAEPVRPFESPVIPPVAASPSAAAAPARASSEYDVPVSWRQEVEAPAAVAPVIATPVAEAPIAPAPVAATPATASEIHVSPVAPTISAAPASEISVEPASPPARPQTIPVFQDAEPEPLTEEQHYEVVPTAAPPVPDIEIAKEPELQETAEETTRNTRAEEREPGLMPTIEPAADPAPVVVAPQAAPVIAIPTFEESQHAREIPIAPAAEQPIQTPTTHGEFPASTGLSDADFEARVAAAMAAYNQPAEAEASQASTAEGVSTASVQHPSSLAPLDLHEQPLEAEPAPVQAFKASEAVPSFVYTPAAAHDESAVASEHVAPVSAQPLQEAAPASAIPEFKEPAPLETDDILESLPNAAPVEAQIAQSEPEDHQHSIAQAVHRVMERLKPELVEEIMRELKSKK